MMEYKHLSIERDGHIAVVTLNHSEKLNALNAELMDEITKAANDFRFDEKTRVVIFTGAGEHFSAGADLTEKSREKFVEASLLMKLRFREAGPRMIRAIYEISQITIAAINGVAYGGAACMVAACDFRVGADDCRVGYPEVKLGMNLSWGALPMCVSLVGPARAKRMVILAEGENADTLLDWGFLDQVVPPDQLLAKSKEMAVEYAALPPIPAQMVKKSINAISGILAPAIMHMDSDQNILTAQTEDYAEGIMAFLEKRKPEFKGN